MFMTIHTKIPKNTDMEQDVFPKTHHSQVLIVGGGLAGVSLALMLGKYHIFTVILDASPIPNNTLDGGIQDIRTTAFMQSSMRYLHTLGVWDKVQSYASPLKTMRIIPILSRNIMGKSVDFNASDVDLPALAYNLDNHTLRAVLCDALADCHRVTHVYDTPATDMIQVNNDWHICTDTGVYSADIIVGADGRQSFVREKVGIISNRHDYQQTAIVFNVHHEYPHNNISTEMMYANGAFTLVPMSDCHQSAVVWVEKTPYATQLIEGRIQDLYTAFMQKTQGIWGTCHILSNIQSFPLHSHMAQTNTVDNVVLMGESHHGLTPVAAQGLNLSLRDSAVLADLLISAHHADWHIAHVVQAYKNKRLTDVKTRSLATGMFHQMARASDPISLGIKTIGVGIFNHTKTARKMAIKAGLSFPGGTPKFMQ